MLLFLCIAWLVTTLPAAAQADPDTTDALVAVIAQHEEFADWLPAFPNFYAEAWGPDEAGVWEVHFHDLDSEEWLGYATVDAATATVIEAFAPKPLPADVYAAQLDLVSRVLRTDPEVLGWLGSVPENYETYADFDRWERVWNVLFYRGLEGFGVRARIDSLSGDVVIEAVLALPVLEAVLALQDRRSRAIDLAYQVDGVWDVLSDYDDWYTYVQWQHDDVWSVSFAANDTTLFYAEVDLTTGTVLQAAGS
jgi:hypothetical protein